MSNIVEMTTFEADQIVGGYLPYPGPSIVQQIEEAYPGGEWHNGAYYPNGVPQAPWTGPETW